MSISKKISISLIVYLIIAICYYLFLTYFVYNQEDKETINLDLKGSLIQFFTIKILDGKSVSLLSLTGSTLYYFTVNFLLASFLGITIGTILGKYKTLGYISNYFINFFRVMPSIIFIVLFKYQFKFINTYVYFVGVFASIWPILISTKSGVEFVNIVQRESVDILNLPLHKKIFLFILPEAFPNIWDGMKIGLGISFLITITCEYLNPSLSGLGALLKSYENDNIFPLVTMSIILWIGLIGIVLNLLFDYLEIKILWLKKQFATN
ncbi:MAG TPA: ABC transporter permease subunit [Chitinophagaceae bacterium]|nr:ABC transporter permease subunit [Chitinophagaceae bacterium]